MDIYRTFLAIIISFLILIGYQYFFVGFGPSEQVIGVQETEQPEAAAPAPQEQVASLTAAPASQPPTAAIVRPDRPAKTLTVDTDQYTAVITEDGGAIESFLLKDYKETLDAESPGMELVKVDKKDGLPMEFSWGSAAPAGIFYEAADSRVTFTGNSASLRMKGVGNGLEIERIYTFSKDSYLIDLAVRVKNVSASALQGSAQLHQSSVPYRHTSAGSNFLFVGPAYYANNTLEEIKRKEFEDGPKVITTAMDWGAYEGTYFISAILPHDTDTVQSMSMETFGEEGVRMTVSSGLDTLQAGQEKIYNYKMYLGPKKLDILKSVGSNLDKAVNFGWFDIIAQPTLWLLNLFYGIFKNYGIAIILVTVLFKAVFWPITQKGMKSMKNMQKLQPKMVKLKEKYKDDPTRMNQEVMNLYKTYKVNPLGGCLPMVLQIPVFFALYKVLLMCIELRHAPFMLWITDLSAPDRLFIGFNIPYVGGIPVLTLLMGGSMFLQQKMTPTTADPTQAKIMMFLPLLFTFMFVNFASGLVLYWFVNNLLAILQQQMINRQKSGI